MSMVVSPVTSAITDVLGLAGTAAPRRTLMRKLGNSRAMTATGYRVAARRPVL